MAAENVLVASAVWHVSENGSDVEGDGSLNKPFRTIATGITAASSYDTVEVAVGSYAENVVLKENVYLRGAGYELTTITAHDHVVTGANGSTIEGFMILNDNQGSSWGYGWSESSTTIRNNVFKGHYVGLHCGQTGSNELIVNNVIIDNTVGITFGWDGTPTIRNNIIMNNNVHWYNDSQDQFAPAAIIAYNNLWNGNYDFKPSPATGNINMDPKFSNALDNDFRLWWDSPCIDSGDPDDQYDDIDGTRNDMGVYGGPFGTTYDYAVPVELVSFTARPVLDVVELSWSTATESNNFGFDIERKAEKTNFRKIAFVKGYGTTTELRAYNYTDKNLQPGTYTYRLKQVDTDGAFAYSREIATQINLPSDLALWQNYPNPFNPSTTISYQLPRSTTVRLSVYNILGELIATLIDGHQRAGYHNVTWHPGDDISNGTYYYHLSAGGLHLVKKAVFLK